MKRAGMTLVEVLVAIFVMGIGLIALLSLFPVGILRIAQAIHDSKCSVSAINATSLAQVNSFTNDPLVVSDIGAFPDLSGASLDLFRKPFAGLPDANLSGPSYPIFVDPLGFFSGGINQWVGGVNGALRRRPVSLITTAANPQLALTQNFKLWDDMPFQSGDPLGGDTPGTPSNIAGTLLRDPRYSWGYMLRRPLTGDRSVVECSILVFDSRPLLTLGETPYLFGVTVPPNTVSTPTYYDPAKNTIYIQYDTVAPAVRPGGWIMDVTQYQNGSTTANLQYVAPGVAPVQWVSQHAYFYRVVAATELPGKLMRFEVQQPIRGFTNPATGVALYPQVANPGDPTGTPLVYNGSSMVFEGLAAVFDRGPMRGP